MKKSRAFLGLISMALMVGACAAQGDDAGDEALVHGSPGAPDLQQDPGAAAYDEEVALGVVSEALIGPNDVGVLAPADTNCPNESVMLTLENEREGNWNDANGWLGASTQDHSYTTLRFCRVDGRTFHRALSASSSTSLNYAVLKLGSTCPAEAVELERYVDNEDRPRGCPSWPWACAVGAPATLGDYAPSYYNANNLHMKLCMFRSSASGYARPMPYIGIPYGVLGTGSLPYVIATGNVHTDDEDDSNGNFLSGDTAGSSAFLTVGANTTFMLAEVSPPPRIVRWPVFDAGELSME